MTSLWPIEIIAIGPALGGAIAWRLAGRVGVTVVAKATFALTPGAKAAVTEPSEIARADHHFDRTPLRSIEVASDLAIYKPLADITFVGHAYAPPGRPTPAMTARIAVFQERTAVLDKTLHVFGDRSIEAGRPGAPRPFQKMPLTYERARASRENPVGMAAGTGKLPNLVDPRGDDILAGFGPISRYAPARRELLEAGERRQLEAPIAELRDRFPWEYFQAAPKDQRIQAPRGDEWIVLDGMHPALPRLATQLPGARGLALVTTYGPTPLVRPVTLALDTIAIDGDRQTVSLTWRAQVPLDDEDALARTRAHVAVELPGQPLAWPDPRALAPPETKRPLPEKKRSPQDFHGTVDAGDDAPPPRAATPFEAGAEAPPPRAATPFEAGAGAPRELGRTVAADEMILPGAYALPFGPTHAAPPGPPASTPAPPSTPASLSAPAPLSVPSGPPSAPSAPPNAAERRAGSPWPTQEPPWPTQEPPAPPDPLAQTRVFEPGAQGFERAPIAPFPIAPAAEPGAPPRSSSIPWLEHAAPADHAFGAGASPRVTLLKDTMAETAERVPMRPPRPRPPAPPLEPPTRSGPEIPIINRTPLTVATLPWQVKPPQDSLTVVVKGTFDLVPDDRAKLREESELPTGDLYLDDDDNSSLAYASDFAIFKPKADIIVTGKAYAPGGSSPAAQVELRFGKKVRRRLAVFGDRRWQQAALAAVASEPKPFTAIPIVYERAFGGPSLDVNPVGAGHRSADSDALPNIEDPAHLVTSPDNARAPACFAPIPITWKQRASKLGTYGPLWLRTRWPYFPDDFDWSYFQSAPPSQQVDYLTGDETFSITGMHPAHPRLDGELPGVRARAFVHKVDDSFQEIVLRLDTAVFDMEALTLNLVWRGLDSVSDEEAPEINALFVMIEELGGSPIELSEARARYMIAAQPPATEEDEPDELDDDEGPANDIEEPAEDDGAAAIEAEHAAREKALREKLRAAGVPDDVEQEAPPPPDPEAIGASLAAAGASPEDVAALLEVLRAPDEDAGEAELAPDDRRARVLAALQAGESLEGVDLEGVDLSDIDFGGASLAGANLKETDLRRASLARSSLAGAQLSDADLRDARLDKADLSTADLTGAKLDGASLAGARLDDATFAGASADRVTFDGATGERAVLEGASLKGARFEGAALPAADFTRATIEGATFRGAKLAEARFYDARGDRAVFDRANLENARAEGASLLKASFIEITAPGSVWEGAKLDDAVFRAAKLAGASFARSSCARCNFTTADMTEARLRRANLAGAQLLKTNLMSATMERADLTGADLRGANLHTAETWRAKLHGANLDLAIVTQSKLADDERTK